MATHQYCEWEDPNDENQENIYAFLRKNLLNYEKKFQIEKNRTMGK
jgi:hypothetical protein